MGMNVTHVFIRTACDALADSMFHLKEKDKEVLCDKLVKLCEKYAPGTFKEAEDESKHERKSSEDLSEMLDDMLED
jgi:hypothetical protein